MSDKISFKGYCWCLGTTSYRTDQFNKNIEWQLQLLHRFWQCGENRQADWQSNEAVQTRYYRMLQEAGFVRGDAPRPCKDAREKTSGLVDFGLLTEDRRLTPAGEALLQMSEREDFTSDNKLLLPRDSYLYLRQLMKMSNVVEGAVTRPFLLLVYFLVRLGSLTLEEFTYLLPLCTDRQKADEMLGQIPRLRRGETTVDDLLCRRLFRMENYQEAFRLWMDSPAVDEALIQQVGINRKSKRYDKKYYPFYRALHRLCLEKDWDAAAEAYRCSRSLSSKPGVLWRKYLFGTAAEAALKRDPGRHLAQAELYRAETEEEFRRIFFRQLHLFKARANLSDYLDLNRRYIKTSDAVLFGRGVVALDVIPKYFFASAAEEIYRAAFLPCTEKGGLERVDEMVPGLVFDEQRIVDGINAEYGLQVRTLAQAQEAVLSERRRRWDRLVGERFPVPVLCRLLELFESRDRDGEIQQTVTDNADIPTIFEYIIGIAWYRMSGCRGDILSYMNLSLDAELLPKTHAGGGEADIVYRYGADAAYAPHALLLEMTVAEKGNQRRMEMEPVSRHLGEYRLRHPDEEAYCVFVSTYLHPTVVADFRLRREAPYYDAEYRQTPDGLKIIPLQTAEIRAALRGGWTYEALYPLFEAAFHSAEPIPTWYQSCVAGRILQAAGNFISD